MLEYPLKKIRTRANLAWASALSNTPIVPNYQSFQTMHNDQGYLYETGATFNLGHDTGARTTHNWGQRE
jgi:hypothetical protein